MTLLEKHREEIKKRMEEYNKENPILGIYEKDGLTLEIREKNYFILLKDGRVSHKGVRLDEELKTYFGV